MHAIALSALLLVLNAHAAPGERWSPATDCRANIRKVTCRVAPESDLQRGDPRYLRVCQGGEAAYAAELIKVHDDLPPKLQKMFCFLRKIYIEEELAVPSRSGRFAQIYLDKQNEERVGLNGSTLNLSRKKVMEFKGSLKEWLSGRDQQIFGRPVDAPLLPEIPQLDLGFRGSKANPVLLYVVLHEFGHLFQSSHRFNSFTCADDGDLCKRIYKSLWSSISWKSDGTIRDEDRYAPDFIPCYEGCNPGQYARIGEAMPLYKSFLEKNSFVTILASASPTQDFAETFVFYMASRYLSDPMDPDGKFFSTYLWMDGDMIQLHKRKRQGSLALKMQFMEMFDVMPLVYEATDSATHTLNDYLEILARFRKDVRGPLNELR